jgi:hypothetical protein
VGGLYYIHERIDKLVEQTALEVALLRLHTGADLTETRAEEEHCIELTRQRFWAAQDAAAEAHQQDLRER